MVIVVIARAYQTRAKAILFSTWKQEGAVALTVLRQCDSHTIATLLSFYILIGGKVAVAQLTIASILLLLAPTLVVVLLVMLLAARGRGRPRHVSNEEEDQCWCYDT